MLDAITFEILRHRLWMINDEQGKIAVRISGSPIVTEVKDFSASLLTPDGQSLFIGAHITRLSIALHLITKSVLAHCMENPGIHDGDMFFTNDPWAGAAHHNDQALIAPVFWKDEIVCWTGIAMHDVDVGGPTYGGFSVRAEDAFSEPPIVPPIKLVEKGEIRGDLERMVLRNSRTVELNALNIRSRIAAQNVARQRLLEVIDEYGRDTFLETQRQVIEMVKRGVTRRLSELPDGVWRVERFMDHDGFENRLYRICLTMRKEGGHLTLDFRGTDSQGRGTVNCAPGGLEGGVYSALLPMLCYDLPWCPAALQQTVEILSEPGSLITARFPAAIGTATVGAMWAVGDAVRACLAKMMAGSDKYRAEAQATWSPGLLGASLLGKGRDGRSRGITASVRAGGAGATGAEDGLDAGGTPGAPSWTMDNVETTETHYPIALFIYRKIQPETAGPGKRRGGAGVETLLMPYADAAPLTAAQYSQGNNHPEAKGLYGGYPSSIQTSLILRNANIKEWLDSAEIPTSLGELRCERTEIVPAKGVSQVGERDLFVSWFTGGAGYGDPMEREPGRVARDVHRLLLTRERGKDLYGVVIDQLGTVDQEATDQLRHEMRQARLKEARPVEARAPLKSLQGRPQKLLSLGEAVDIVSADGLCWAVCPRCRYNYGIATVDPKHGAYYRERALSELSSLNRFAAGGNDFVFREFLCPGCALLIDVQVLRPKDPVLYDCELILGAAQAERGRVAS